MDKKKVSRREFLKKSGVSSIAITAMTHGPAFGASQPPQAAPVDRYAIFATLGDTLIPTDPGDPGYKGLEKYKITEEVMKGLDALSNTDLDAFNKGSAAFFNERSFLQLTESQRADYLRLIIDGSKFTDKTQLRVLQRIYRQTRTRVFTLFYQNYPENVIPRDQNGVPILKPGDDHQITNPNTKELMTGWDTAGFKGPLGWEEEDERRARFKKIHWHE